MKRARDANSLVPQIVLRNPRYSFIVPVLDEEESLPQLLDRLALLMDELDGEAELVLIDDGSTDSSNSMMRAAADSDPRIKLLELSRNFGHQIAITAAADFARGDAVVILDADLQDPPGVVLEMIKKWREGYDIVYGVRTTRAGDSYFKRVTARLFYRSLKMLVAFPAAMEAGDFRLIDRRALVAFQKLREHNRFVRGMWAWVGFRQAAVYYQRHARTRGESKYPLAKMLRLAAHGIISFSDIPLQIAIWIGALVSCLGALYGCYVVALWLQGEEQLVSGWSSLIVIVTFLGGVQLTLLGIVGLYVGRIHEEVKNRPLYVLSDVVGIEELPRVERAVVARSRTRPDAGDREGE